MRSIGHRRYGLEGDFWALSLLTLFSHMSRGFALMRVVMCALLNFKESKVTTRELDIQPCLCETV